MKCECGAVVEVQGSAADYPYDPGLQNWESLPGLERLRGMPDRAEAERWFQLYWRSAHNDTCKALAERERAGQHLRDAQERRCLLEMARAALEGEYGTRGQDIANVTLSRDFENKIVGDLGELRFLREELAREGCARTRPDPRPRR